MQIETMRYHYSHIRIARIQSSDIPHAAKNVYQQDLSSIAGANVKWHNHFGRQFGGFYKIK